MPNGFKNPFTAPLTAIKQIGEQTTSAINSMGTGLSQAASQGIDALISGTPPIPGVTQTGAGGIPTPAQLMPANLQQALGRVQNLLIPQGLGRPTVTPTPTVTETAPPAATEPVDNAPVVVRQQIIERRGL